MSTNHHFGTIIAYLIPGFIGLVGLVPVAPIVSEWLKPVSVGDGGLGPPIYAVLAATAMGILANAVRWFTVDFIQHSTGVRRPKWNFGLLQQNLEAFHYLVDGHYRFYQTYANSLVSLLFAYLVNRLCHTSPLLGLGSDFAVVALSAILFVTSRNCLEQYYGRVGELLTPNPSAAP